MDEADASKPCRATDVAEQSAPPPKNMHAIAGQYLLLRAAHCSGQRKIDDEPARDVALEDGRRLSGQPTQPHLSRGIIEEGHVPIEVEAADELRPDLSVGVRSRMCVG